MIMTSPNDILDKIRARRGNGVEPVPCCSNTDMDTEKLKEIAAFIRRVEWDEEKQEWYDPGIVDK